MSEDKNPIDEIAHSINCVTVQIDLPRYWGAEGVIVDTVEMHDIKDVIWRQMCRFTEEQCKKLTVENFAYCRDITCGFDTNSLCFEITFKDEYSTEVFDSTVKILKQKVHESYMQIPLAWREKAAKSELR